MDDEGHEEDAFDAEAESDQGSERVKEVIRSKPAAKIEYYASFDFEQEAAWRSEHGAPDVREWTHTFADGPPEGPLIAIWRDGWRKELPIISNNEFKSMKSFDGKPRSASGLWERSLESGNGSVMLSKLADRNPIFQLKLKHEDKERRRALCQIRVNHYGCDESSETRARDYMIKLGEMFCKDETIDLYKIRDRDLGISAKRKGAAASIMKRPASMSAGDDETNPMPQPKTTKVSREVGKNIMDGPPKNVLEAAEDDLAALCAS